MAQFLQALSDKAKETRTQFSRTPPVPAATTVTSKAEIPTSQGPAVLTESVHVSSSAPVASSLPGASSTHPKTATSSVDRAHIKAEAPSGSGLAPIYGQPLSNRARLYLLGIA